MRAADTDWRQVRRNLWPMPVEAKRWLLGFALGGAGAALLLPSLGGDVVSVDHAKIGALVVIAAWILKRFVFQGKA